MLTFLFTIAFDVGIIGSMQEFNTTITHDAQRCAGKIRSQYETEYFRIIEILQKIKEGASNIICQRANRGAAISGNKGSR